MNPIFVALFIFFQNGNPVDVTFWDKTFDSEQDCKAFVAKVLPSLTYKSGVPVTGYCPPVDPRVKEYKNDDNSL